MVHENKTSHCSKCYLSVRVNAEQKALVVQAAEREGLQVSSFIIMLLVRFRILPDSCLRKIKRCPVPHFNALHGLLGVVNKVGGNCKQLASVFPDAKGLSQTHAHIIEAAAVVTDALHGQKVPDRVDLYRLQGDMIREGHVFNRIVKSVNVGRPNLAGLPAALFAIHKTADRIIKEMTGELDKHMATPHARCASMKHAEGQREKKDKKASLKTAALEHTKHQRSGK